MSFIAEQIFDVGGPDYLLKHEIITTFDMVNAIEQYLVRKPSSKALDLAQDMKRTLYVIADMMKKMNTIEEEEKRMIFLKGVRGLIFLNYEYPEKFHLLAKACSQVDVDLNKLKALYRIVYTLGEKE